MLFNVLRGHLVLGRMECGQVVMLGVFQLVHGVVRFRLDVEIKFRFIQGVDTLTWGAWLMVVLCFVARVGFGISVLLGPLGSDDMCEFLPVMCFLLKLLEIDGSKVGELFGSILVIKVCGIDQVQKLFISFNVVVEVLFELLNVLYTYVNE